MSLYRIAILTASDKGAAGLREDRSGPVIAAALASVGTIVTTEIVADDRQRSPGSCASGPTATGST
jgi:molybdopterin biosynthesis enzyme MoaB